MPWASTLFCAVALGGCYLEHGLSGRDGGLAPDASHAPPHDAEVPPDGGPASCTFDDPSFRFEVQALAPGLPGEPRGIDDAERIYLEVEGRAMRWSRHRGLEPLGMGLPPGEMVHIAAVERDGSIAGALDGLHHPRAFVWRPTTGMVELSLDDGIASIARGITADGMALVDEGPRASLRTMTGHTLPLGLPPDGNPRNADVDALDVAANGTVVGSSSADRTLGVWRAFVWTTAGGIELLPNDGARFSRALAISDDGAIIVGAASILDRDDEVTPVRWRGRVLERIPLLAHPELVGGAATDVTNDGVIVGTDVGAAPDGSIAYGWMMAGERKVALDARLAPDAAGWHVERAIGVTEDLRVLAVAERMGSGVHEPVLLTPRCDVAR